jgi:hypothetical protein
MVTLKNGCGGVGIVQTSYIVSTSRGRYALSRTKLSTRLTLPCNFTSQIEIKEHLDLGWNAAGTFPSHCDFLNLAMRIRRRS